MKRKAARSLLIPLFALLCSCGDATQAPLAGSYVGRGGFNVEFTADGRYLVSGIEAGRFTIDADHADRFRLTLKSNEVYLGQRLGPDVVRVILPDDALHVYRVGSAAAQSPEATAPPDPPPSAPAPEAH
jgi:hypothetical protein